MTRVINTPLILTNKDDYTAAKEHCHKHNISTGYVLGGTGLIGDPAANDVFGIGQAVSTRKLYSHLKYQKRTGDW